MAASGTAGGGRAAMVVAAGGSGGHLFPAQALAEELGRRGYEVHLMSDKRVRGIGQHFPAAAIHELPSATMMLSRPWRLPVQFPQLWRGYRRARQLMTMISPLCVIGFGGYPSFPPVLAAARAGVATVIHEQNAVMGRANRVLSTRVDAIASSFPEISNLSEAARARTVLTGNPVRDRVRKLAQRAYRASQANEPFNLVVFGGSQGAQFLSQLMPQVMETLPAAIRRRLRLTQQCRAEDIARVETSYRTLGLQADLATFFADLPQRLARAHLVICRSGASSIAELAVLGRPAILVPLPHSIDSDQMMNAHSFASAGGGWVKQQAGIEPEAFGAFITRLRYAPDELSAAASAARRFGRPDAASLLADEVERLASAARRKPTGQPEAPAPSAASGGTAGGKVKT